MDVLFICKGNYGRSQMAEAIFNSLSCGRAVARSAGADSAVAGRGRLREEAPMVVKCMGDIGLDVSDNVSKIITREMFDGADLVVSMVEDGMLPGYAQNSGKVVFWEVEDPHYLDERGYARIRDQIYGNVSKLVEGLKGSDARRSRER